MYYTFGKTDNKIRIDKNNRLALDVTYFLKNESVTDDGFVYYFKGSKEEYYIIKDKPITIDGIQVISNKPSCFYSKKELINSENNLFIHNGILFDGNLIETINLSLYFTKAFDSTDTLPVYISTQKFINNKIKFNNSVLKPLQYLVFNPISSIIIDDILYDNHIFVLSKLYTLRYAVSYKLYMIPYGSN